MSKKGKRHRGTASESTALYKFICDFKARHCGVSPSYREIAEGIHCSIAVVRVRLDILEEQGLICRYNNESARAIMVPNMVCVQKPTDHWKSIGSNEPTHSWKCNECNAIVASSDVLYAVNPFNEHDTLVGCPVCGIVNELYLACNTAGCTNLATCGLPNADGTTVQSLCYDCYKVQNEKPN